MAARAYFLMEEKNVCSVVFFYGVNIWRQLEFEERITDKIAQRIAGSLQLNRPTERRFIFYTQMKIKLKSFDWSEIVECVKCWKSLGSVIF